MRHHPKTTRRAPSPELSFESAPVEAYLARELAIHAARPFEDSIRNFPQVFEKGAPLLEHLATRANQEQEWFWSRFSAFATLQAGLFVLFTSGTVGEGHRHVFALFGLALAVLWLLVQGRSHYYVHQAKRPYHTFRMILGLKGWEPTLPFWRRAMRNAFASTSLGLLTTVSVTLIWAFVVFEEGRAARTVVPRASSVTAPATSAAGSPLRD